MARLIDADKWIEKLTKVINDDEAPGELKDYNLMLINEISAEPTAYISQKEMTRLIDAIALNRIIFEIGCHKTKIDTMEIMDIVEKQPTAYDPEKVIEEISKVSELIRPVGWVRKIEVIETKAAIEKIKKGGIE